VSDLAVIALEHFVHALKERPDLAADLRDALLPDAKEPPAEVPILTVSEFAKRVGVCGRTVSNWIERGLPVMRRGRVRRIDVAAANAWLGDRGSDRELATDAERAAAKVRRSLPVTSPPQLATYPSKPSGKSENSQVRSTRGSK